MKSIKELAAAAESRNVRISDIVIELQAEENSCTAIDVFEKMSKRYDVMLEAVERGVKSELKTVTGLSGGDAALLDRYIASGRALGNGLSARITRNAIAVSEVNANMGRIVASPTAGSCGIIPGFLSALEEELSLRREKVIMALITAGGIGAVIAENATLAGAEGGCQAECGSAAAMAAAAGCELLGGTPQQCAHAFSLSMINSLGLVCDPVGGYVEYPCIFRNAHGAVNALAAMEMALSGVKSIIPSDEVIAAMKEVGVKMDTSLKETALGGLAAAPSALRLCRHSAD